MNWLEKQPVNNVTDPDLESAILSARILVVDDLQANVELVVGLLNLGGYTEITAMTDSPAALEQAATGTFDLILVDMRMPVIDGIEFTRRVRALKLTNQPSIVALTAQTDEDTRRAALV